MFLARVTGMFTAWLIQSQSIPSSIEHDTPVCSHSSSPVTFTNTTLQCVVFGILMATLYPADTIDGSVTSYVPLTTVYTPPSSCSTIFRQDGPSYVAYDPGYGLEISSNTICQPPAVTTWWEQKALGDPASDHTAVSIGPLTCPSSWVTVATSVKDSASTAAMCCPP